MEKRKLQINILDVAIVVVIICSIAVLVFNDTIKEAVGKPEITDINVCVAFKTDITAEQTLVPEGSDVVFQTVTGDKIKLNSKIARTVAVEKEGDKEIKNVVVTFKGYKKLGRFYTESGQLISIGSDCTLTLKGIKNECTVKSINLNG